MEDNKLRGIDSLLGQKVDYKSEYDPDILVREPRITNRVESDITSPMVGFDVWNAYEISFLKSNGQPVHAIGKIIYNQDSEYIVESKSLKLYLNSFNMQRIETKDSEEALKIVSDIIQIDLEKLLETTVEVYLYDMSLYHVVTPDYLTYRTFQNIDSYLEGEVTKYNEDIDILQGDSSSNKRNYFLSSALLRSNCKVTHQPDWGTVYMYIKCNYDIYASSLVKYIISFRNENHFHEEIVETIYDRLYKVFKPDELLVCAKYTRRGGIDINPMRASKKEILHKDFISGKIHHKTLQQ